MMEEGNLSQTLDKKIQFFDERITEDKIDKITQFLLSTFNFELLNEYEKIELSTTEDNDISICIGNRKPGTVYVDCGIYIFYNIENNKVYISEINDWRLYEKVRDLINEKVRDVLDKFLPYKPRFNMHHGYVEWKEYILTILNKLVPIANELKRIEILLDIDKYGNDDFIGIVLNNIELQGYPNDFKYADIPYNEIKRLFKINHGYYVRLYKENLWAIKIDRKYSGAEDEFNALGISDIYDIYKISPLFELQDDYIALKVPGNDYLYIISRDNLKKFLKLHGIPTEVKTTGNSFEIIMDDKKYEIFEGENDEIHVKILKNNKLQTLKTYLWYFNVRSFEELKKLDKIRIADIIEDQINEMFFYPMPFDEVKKKVQILLDNTLSAIDEAIDTIKYRQPSFTQLVKDIISISCIFKERCGVGLELDGYMKCSRYLDSDRLDSADVSYSLLATDYGHMPIPIFLEYLGYRDDDCLSEFEISLIKNIIYFIRGYGIYIPLEERERVPPDEEDYVRDSGSVTFEEAVVLYNKIRGEPERYSDDEEGCPEETLPDGLGYCRRIEDKELLNKTEDELSNDLISTLMKIKEEIHSYRNKISPNIKEPSDEVTELAFRLKDQLSTVHSVDIKLVKHGTNIEIRPEEYIEMSDYFFERMRMFLENQLGFRLTNTHEEKDRCVPIPIFIGTEEYRKDNVQIVVHYKRRDTIYGEMIYDIRNLEVGEIDSE